jgi:hypothetical protein
MDILQQLSDNVDMPRDPGRGIGWWVASMKTQDVGRLTNPGRWRQALPDPLFHSLLAWIEGQGFDVTHQRWLTGGRSGCFVAMVTLTPGCGKVRGAVMKLFPPGLAARESRGVSLAKQNSPPDFYRSHMVDTTEIDPLPNSDWWLHIQAVADADLARTRPLAELIDDPRLAHFCELVTSTITERWGESKPDQAPIETTLSRFMAMEIADHMEQLAKFADVAKLDLKRPQPMICLAERPCALPNPLAILNSTIGARHSVAVYTSNGHGDLHARNVLMLPDDDTFRMIDYGRFSPRTPVSRDLVKLVLSIVEHWLGDLTPTSNARRRLAEILVRPREVAPEAAVSGYHDVVKRAFDAASAWGVQRHLTVEWHQQYLLILASSALRTVARDDVALADRWWFLEVSALAIADLIKATLNNANGHGSWPDRSLADLKETNDQFDFWFDVLSHRTT